MPSNFNTSNGDTGLDQSSSVQPVVNGEPADAAHDGRPIENLRIRTQILGQVGNATELASAGEAMVFMENNGASTGLNWDGVELPLTTTYSTLTTEGTPQSGRLWLNANSRIIIETSNSGPTNLPTTILASPYNTVTNGILPGGAFNLVYQLSSVNQVPITITPTAISDAIYNIRIFWQTGVNPSVNNCTVTTQDAQDTAYPATTGTIAPGAAYTPPAPPAGSDVTVAIQVRADGTTTVANINAALSAAFSGNPPYILSSTSTFVPPNVGSLSAVTPMDTLSIPIPQFTTLPVRRTLIPSVLKSFFDAGIVSNGCQLTGSVGTGLQVVSVSSVTNLYPGLRVTVDTGGSAEEVTIVSISGSNIQAVFANSHSTSAAVVGAANALRPGDILAVNLGDPVSRLNVTSQIVLDELVLVRNASITQNTYLVPIAVVDQGKTDGTNNIYFAGIHGIRLGQTNDPSNYVQLGGVLGGTTTDPTLANNSITTAMLQNGSVTGAKIASSTITGSNIAATTITGSNIVNSTITGTQIGSSITLAGSPTVANNLTVTDNITSTTGNIAATAGSITAGDGLFVVTGDGQIDAGSLTVHDSITAVTGNIACTAGQITAGTSVIAQDSLVATTGNLLVSAGHITATAGSVTAGTTVTAGTGITATTGDITATTGDITATAGNIVATAGTLSSGGASVTGQYGANLNVVSLQQSSSAGTLILIDNTGSPIRTWVPPIVGYYRVECDVIDLTGGDDPHLTLTWTNSILGGSYAIGPNAMAPSVTSSASYHFGAVVYVSTASSRFTLTVSTSSSGFLATAVVTALA